MKQLTTKFNNILNKINPVSFFVVVGVIFGLFFCIVTPPFQTPDEPVHFFRAYQISNFNFSVDKIGSKYGGILPESIEDTVSITTTPQLQFMPNRKYDINKTKIVSNIETDKSKTHIYEFSTTAYYSPISYLPQSIGIFIGRIFNLAPIWLMYTGRLFNLTSWLMLFGISIHLLPRKKWVLVCIGLIPMALFQASSLSSDVMATGLLALFLCYLLYLIDKKRILNNFNLLKISTIATGLALSKQVMFVFIPLILLIPNKQFKKKSSFYTKIILLSIPIIGFILWMLYVGRVDLSTSINGINPELQLNYILKNFHHYLNVVWNTYFYSWGDGITRSFIGNFGWVDTPLSELVVTIGYLSLFVLLIANETRYKTWLNRYQKIILTLIAITYLGAVTTALYMYFTPVAFKIVIGLVGRYYFPIALLLIPLFFSSWLTITKKAYKTIAILSPIFLLITSLITIVVRYYINNV